MSNIKNSAYIYKMTITSKNGEVIDIKNIFKNFNIYENMFSHFLTGDILLQDTSDILKNLPIIGGEDVEIQFGEETNNSAMVFDMVIVAEPQQLEHQTGKNKTENIFLRLASKSAINNRFQRISQKFKDEKSSIVDKMVRLYLKSTKALSQASQAGNGNIEFVANNWLATDIIDYICNQSKDAFFFEHNRQFFTFDTLTNLINQSITLELYTVKDFEQSLGINHVLAWKFDTKFDLESSYLASMFGQTVYKPSLENYGYEKKNKSLDEILGSELPLMGSNKLFKEDFSTQDNHIALTYKDIDSKLYRNMIIQTLQHYNLVVQTRGSSDRKCGDMIRFNMPSIDNTQAVNENFSDKWLITQLKHSINSTLEYKQVMRLWKNSFANNPKV